ncbi:MAG: ABC transporter ATP-binding protein, partial [Oscillospiraceae bacterium]|nr:ABC transporter ATP-binding protein [Oscillospiraceae bacterium]
MKRFIGLKKNSPTGKILHSYLWRIWLLAGMSVIQSLLQVGMALIFQRVIDTALSGGERLTFWSVLLVADLLLQVLVYALFVWFTESTVDNLTAALRSELLRNAVNCADSRLESFHSGQLLSRGIEDVRSYCDGIVHALPSLVGQLTRLVAVVAAILLIYPALAAVLLAAGALVLVGVAILRPVLRKKHRAVRKADEKVLSVMQEDMQQLVLIQSLDIQSQIMKRFARRQKKSLEARFNLRRWSVGSSSFVNAAALLGSGLLLLWGGIQVASGMLSYGALTALIQLLNQFRAPVLSLSGLWTRFASVEVSTERLCDLLETPQAEKKKMEDIHPIAVVFENVTFCYEGEETPV